MNYFRPRDPDDTVIYLYAEKIVASFQEQMLGAERLADELNELLVNYESTLEHEGMRGKVEMLSRWAERYRYGLLAADKISRNGKTWLAGLGSRLQIGARELARLEGEGGPPAVRPGEVAMEDFTAAAQQMGAIASRIEYLFGRPATKPAHAGQ